MQSLEPATVMVAARRSPAASQNIRASARIVLWAALGVICFHLAYAFPALAFLMAVFLYGLGRLADARSARGAFYLGLLTGLACYVPQLLFLAHIFRLFAVPIWILLALWIGLFALIIRGLKHSPRFPRWIWIILMPVIWTGLEYFRCELYYFRFAWLTPGLALGQSALIPALGVYGAGFILASAAAIALALRRWPAALAAALLLTVLALFTNLRSAYRDETPTLRVTAIQLEFPEDRDLRTGLDTAISRFPDTQLLVLPEYTFGMPVPTWMRDWCRQHGRFLIVGAEDVFTDPATGKEKWSDTAFVINPAGQIVFSQAKAVPIQFFVDGEPARQQRVWDSPWGKIGICICYDLDFSRVTDELVRQGAQILIVPTMDVASWGAQEHRLHALIAPARAAEYQVPIVRVASSGLSEVVMQDGRLQESLEFHSPVAILSARITPSRFGHLPVDRYVAPFCSAMTGIALAALTSAAVVRRFRRGKGPQS